MSRQEIAQTLPCSHHAWPFVLPHALWLPLVHRCASPAQHMAQPADVLLLVYLAAPLWSRTAAAVSG